MTVNIYADEMFFINFIVNVAIIEIAKRILKLKVNIWRETIAGICTSLVYTLFVVTSLRVYINIFTIVILNTAELIFLFKPKSFVDCFKYSVTFKLVSFGTNSCVLFLTNYIKNKFSYWVLILSFIVTYLSYIVLNILNKEVVYYKINIKCSDKIVSIRALVDTGNSLVEPISNKPVIVAEYSALKDILPCKLIEIYENKKESNLMEIISAISEDSFRKSIRIIPFKSVGKERGMMIGFVADSAKINDNVINKPIIGICRFSLSKNGLYSALLSPKHLGGI